MRILLIFITSTLGVHVLSSEALIPQENVHLTALEDSTPAPGKRNKRGSPLPKINLSSGSSREMPPELADFFRRAYHSPGLKGDILYTARKHCSVRFSLEPYDHVAASDVVLAQLHLYQITPKKPIPAKRGLNRQAKVSIHQVTKRGKKLTSVTRVLDSKLVSLDDSGWVTFDITLAVQAWLKKKQSNYGLEVWVESTGAGSHASRVARKTKFIKPNSKHVQQRPGLVLYFKSQFSRE